MKFTSALALCLAIADGYAPGITPPNPSRGGKRTVSVLGTSAKRPQRPHHRLLFVADDGVHGPELWVTEGTAATTHMIADIDPSPPHFDMDRCLNTFYVD